MTTGVPDSFQCFYEKKKASYMLGNKTMWWIWRPGVTTLSVNRGKALS